MHFQSDCGDQADANNVQKKGHPRKDCKMESLLSMMQHAAAMIRLGQALKAACWDKL